MTLWTSIEAALRKRRGVKRSIIFGVSALVIAGGWSLASTKPATRNLTAGPIQVTARPITVFDQQNPGRQRFGRLQFRGGLELTSPATAFGGWSALALATDGRRLLSISDTGVWLTGELTYEAGRPSGIAHARLGALLDPTGHPWKRGKDRDSEGVAIVSGTVSKGEALISFEQNHRIGRFPVSEQGVGAPTGFLTLPPEVSRLRLNTGLEAVCKMQAGRDAGAVVTLAERFPSTDGNHVGWVQQGSGWRTLSIRNIGEFDLTDCNGLPDGSLLVLERRFHWLDVFDGVRMRLRRFSSAELASGQPMEGEILIEAHHTQEIDNMEGLATHLGPNGETIITMISDDNFNHLMQRTILLQFALMPRSVVESAPAQ